MLECLLVLVNQAFMAESILRDYPYPYPRVIYRQPRVVRERVYIEREPIYMRVPPGHAKNSDSTLS